MELPPLTPRRGETCSMLWNRLTEEERECAREWQQITHHPTITSWLLARGCAPVYQPPHPPRSVPQAPPRFVDRRVIRRPSGPAT